MTIDMRQSLRQVQYRYGVMVLWIATAMAAVLMAAGCRSLGKGLVLGVLFSLINFWAMALILPMQFDPRRSRSTLVSMGSILLRFGLMTVPIVTALKSSQFALSTVVIGLFGVQVAILGDLLWTRLREFITVRR